MKCGDLVGGRFEVGAVVREGGMGLVFRAFDRDTGKRCAVKTLIEASKAHAERFEREAALLSALRHPAVVSYVAHGFDRDEPYLVMDWLEGEELGDRLARGPLTEAEAREVARRIAEALGAAHVLGVVHRDVKPSNIVLVENDVARAMLIDFGVARADVGPRRTRTGLVLGTPGYMAPEQARASRDVNARADVYALGCVLFECLIGKPPFTGEHPVAVLAKVLLDEPPRLRSLAPSIAPDLDALVGRMLSKDPTKRPDNGDAVARALRDSSGSSRAPNESVMPESITDDERIVVHVILAAKFADRTDALGRTIAEHDDTLESPAYVTEIEERFGLHVDLLADGSVLATVRPGALGPKGGAARAATIARELAAATDEPVALASGFERMKRGMPLGEVVDHAVDIARQAARTGISGVLVDELTASLLAGSAHVVSRDGMNVLGDASRPAETHVFVGRERELAVLEGLFDEVATEHSARVAMVTSPPGGGKTRLLMAALNRVREHEGSSRVCSVRCDQTTSQSPLAVATQIVFSLCAIGLGEPAEERRARLSARLETTRLPSEAKQRVVDFLGDVIGATTSPSLALLAARTDAMTMSDQVQRAFVDFLRACCDAPLVLAVDDMQWCDRGTFRLLEAVVRDLEGAPLFFLGLARPDVDEAFPAAFAERALTRLPLSALGKRAAESLVRDVAPAATDDIVTEIVKRGEGNAFMLEQLARGARDGHALGDLGGTTAVVAARFETLSVEARRVLRAASVVGQRFSAAAVAALVGSEANAPWLAAVCEELERAEVLVQRDGALGFRHALLRDAAYATLTNEDKTRGHKLAARFFETAPDTDPAVVASHAELGGDVERAARAYVDAAQSALEGIDLAGVAERVKSAMRCGAAGALLGRAHRLGAEAAFWLGALRESDDHATRAIELLDPSTPEFFVAAQYVVGACSRLGQAERALEATRRILTSPGTAATTAARATALLTSASFLPLQGQVDLAKAILRDIKPVVAALAPTNPALPARYSRSRAVCAMASGEVDEFLASTRDAAAQFASVGDRRNELAQRANIAYALIELGEYALAAREGEAVVRDAEALGLRNVVALAKQNAGYALVNSGAVHEEQGMRILESALAEYVTQGHARMAGGTRIYIATAHFISHRYEDAAREIDQALEALASTPPLRAYALAVRARIDVRRADVPRALAAAQEALALLDSLGGVDSGETDVYLAAVEARIAAGDEAGARTILRRGRERLDARAARLEEAHRVTFLTHVSSNAELSKLAAAMLTFP